MHEYVECGDGFGSGNFADGSLMFTQLSADRQQITDDVTCPTEGYSGFFSLHLQGQQFICGLGFGRVQLAPVSVVVQHSAHDVSGLNISDLYQM